MGQSHVFDRFKAFQRAFTGREIKFLAWWNVLKRCYPAPDYLLAFWMRSNNWQISAWKRGIRRPQRSTIQVFALMVLIRCDRMRSIRDLERSAHLTASGAAKLVDECLKREARAEARKAAREAAKKAAKSANGIET